MNQSKMQCFVIMPFSGELHYFFLFLKQHIEQTHKIACHRADDKVLTVPILEKINEYIQKADVVIADCSGKNANVMYELGLTHAHKRNVVLITRDPISEAPTDIRHFEFIKYKLDEHLQFITKLDSAINNILFERYAKLYALGEEMFHKFKEETGSNAEMATIQDFTRRVRRDEQIRPIPDAAEGALFKQFVFPKMIAEAAEVKIMQEAIRWIEQATSLGQTIE